MKHAVSISLGSTRRDKRVEATLLGERIVIERIGTNGDMQAAAKLYKEMDGKVDAFGVGGTDLGVLIDGKFYPLYSIHPMIRDVKQTPLVDGSGLKNTLEGQALPALLAHLGISFPDPLLTLITLTGAAIPYLRICEEGLVNLKDGKTLELIVTGR